MKNYSFMLLFLLLVCLANAQQQTIQQSIYFKSNQFKLTTEHQAQIQNLIDSSKSFTLEKIIIKGYTDSDADSIYNINLSQNRANEVRNFLLKNEMNAELITENYFGENLAGVDSIFENMKSKNRRVDIIFIKQNEKPKLVFQDSCKDGDTSLVMENGTIFKMKKCNLRKLGTKIQFTETFSSAQMVQQGMNTNTDNEGQLISGGMISIGNNSPDCSFSDTLTVYIPIKDSCINPNLLSLWARNGNSWSPSKSSQLKMVSIENKQFFEIKLTKCIKLNLDYKMPSTKKITIINPVKDYQLYRIEMYSDCPRYYWQFTKIKGNQKKLDLQFANSEPMIKIWLLNKNDKKDTLISDFIPLNSLNHKVFGGFSGVKNNEYNQFLLFKIKEKKLYHHYYLRRQNFEKVE